MADHRRTSLRLALSAAFLSVLIQGEATAQEPPADAGEISRDLLYHPARAIEHTAGEVIFRAVLFTYRLNTATLTWQVVREKNQVSNVPPPEIKRFENSRRGLELRFAGASKDDRGILEIRRGSESDSARVAELKLWSRRQLAEVWLARLREVSPDLTREKFEELYEASEPEVAAVVDDGAQLWLGIRHYAGEGVLGLGTIVQLDPASGATNVFQPREIGTSSITHIVAAGNMLWLGTQQQGEGAVVPTAGLVRFDPATGQARSFLPDASPIVGSMVTALSANGDDLWVATDAGFCRIALAADTWTCWRAIPAARVAAPLAVSNRPGGPPRGRLPTGNYEVRWANAAYLELVTPDGMEGWVERDDFVDYARRRFDAEPYELGNTYGGGAAVMRLLDKLGGDPLASAQAYRVELERVGSSSADNWQKVRAKAGWVARKGIDVLPIVQRVEK